jgi:tetratricopeptide (TPR) repeat protein
MSLPGAKRRSNLSLEDFTQNAITGFEAAIELNPNYYYPYQIYANWLFNHSTKENIEKAAAELKMAVTLNPKITNDAIALYFTIEKRFTKLKMILPDTPDNHYKVMCRLIDAGLWQDNEADFKADMERSAYKYPYYKAISDYYAKTGDAEKSIQTLRDYLKIDPNYADAHFYIADKMVYIKPVKWDEIFVHYDIALALDPDNMFYREWYARHLYFAKRYNKAISELEIVVNKDSWNVELLRLLGDWYKVVGRYSDVREMYDKAADVWK